eukprot:TRINITY_DN3281_c0_g1_i6.p1 TRINITY_DN3281_c0_g1~~TRINITY_DN3281_c0_g1_i6.p1  ORF type:complete len:903 (-),score=225.10 TRINITY_DN3281_c0_g1_i6:64-2772(-)
MSLNPPSASNAGDYLFPPSDANVQVSGVDMEQRARNSSMVAESDKIRDQTYKTLAPFLADRNFQTMFNLAKTGSKQAELILPVMKDLRHGIEEVRRHPDRHGLEPEQIEELSDDFDILLAKDPYTNIQPANVDEFTRNLMKFPFLHHLIDDELRRSLLKIAQEHQQVVDRFKGVLANTIRDLQVDVKFLVFKEEKFREAKEKFVKFLLEVSIFDQITRVGVDDEWCAPTYEWACNQVDGGFPISPVFNQTNTKFTKHHAFKQAWELYNNADHQDVAVGILDCIARRHTNEVFNFLNYLLLEDGASIAFEHLEMIVDAGIRGSSVPLEAALDAAALYGNLSKIWVSEAELYEEASKNATNIAIAIVNALPSDQLAYLLLWAKRKTGKDRDITVIDLALLSENVEFLSCPRVSRIKDAIWSDPVFMSHRGMVGSVSIRSHLRRSKTFNHVFRITHLPVWKYMMTVVCNFIFMILYSCMLLNSNIVDLMNLDGYFPISTFEAIIFVLDIGYWFYMAKSLNLERWNYFYNFWNWIDNLINLGFVTLFALRLLVIELHGNKTLNVIIVVFYILQTLLIWYRFLHSFVDHFTLGPLIQIFKKMLIDVFHFLVLAGVLVFSFSFAFYFVVADQQLSGYYSYGRTMSTLTQSFFGNFDITQFDNTSNDNVKRVLIVMATSYQLLSNIVLVNMLIAMMSQTYNIIGDRARQEFLFLKTQLVKEFDFKDSTMPPPFNLVIYAVLIVSYLYAFLKNVVVSACGGCFPNLLKTYWICQHCLHHNDQAYDSEPDLIRYVDQRDPTKLNVLKTLIDVKAPVCGKCFRYKRVVSELGLHAEWYSQLVVLSLLVISTAVIVLVGLVIGLVLTICYTVALCVFGIPIAAIVVIYMFLFRRQEITQRLPFAGSALDISEL